MQETVSPRQLPAASYYGSHPRPDHSQQKSFPPHHPRACGDLGSGKPRIHRNDPTPSCPRRRNRRAPRRLRSRRLRLCQPLLVIENGALRPDHRKPGCDHASHPKASAGNDLELRLHAHDNHDPCQNEDHLDQPRLHRPHRNGHRPRLRQRNDQPRRIAVNHRDRTRHLPVHLLLPPLHARHHHRQIAASAVDPALARQAIQPNRQPRRTARQGSSKRPQTL